MRTRTLKRRSRVALVVCLALLQTFTLLAKGASVIDGDECLLNCGCSHGSVTMADLYALQLSSDQKDDQSGSSGCNCEGCVCKVFKSLHMFPAAGFSWQTSRESCPWLAPGMTFPRFNLAVFLFRPPQA